jgi:hypothetical protein
MSLSAENRAGPAFVVIDDFQPASVAPASDDTRWEGPISQKPQKSGETKDRKKPIDNERSGETAFDEAVRMKKVFKGGLKESKWVVPGLDPVKSEEHVAYRVLTKRSRKRASYSCQKTETLSKRRRHPEPRHHKP